LLDIHLLSSEETTMATTAAAVPGFRQTNRSTDRIFFPIFTLAILAVVIRGFANTYYMAGMLHAPLPNGLIHLHGAVFSCWLIMLAVQTCLVTAGRTDIHRKLGYVGFGLVCLMVVMGVLAATDMLRRGVAPPPLTQPTFYVIPITDILLFAGYMYAAFKEKSHPAVHKRLIMIGTVAIMDAAIARFPYDFIQKGPHWHGDGLLYSFLVALMVYDIVSTKRVQKVTIWGSIILIVVEQVRVPLGMTPVWAVFAHFMAAHLRV
jgi:hypothetical protein